MHKKDLISIHISKLIVKEIQGIIRSEELSQLEEWKNQSELNREIYDRCTKASLQQKRYKQLKKINATESWNELSSSLGISRSIISNKTKVFNIKRISYYAAAVLIIAFASWYMIKISVNKQDFLQDDKLVLQDYEPAENKAIIKLSDGTVLELDENQEQIAIEGNEIRYADGKKLTELADLTFASIETPKGGYYKLVLADGTQVQLNASSSITYPLQFNGTEREVTVQGEAFFDVVENQSKPFIVKTKDQEIRVLGTSFNINAYDDSQITKTTLLRGKVKVSPKFAKNTSAIQLNPGEQGILTLQGIRKEFVDTNQEVAWIHGKFNFDGKKLREVMKELSRWYNVDVIYEGEIPNVEFFGGTFRDSKLSTILDLLADDHIDYQLTNDRKLIIRKSNEKK